MSPELYINDFYHHHVSIVFAEEGAANTVSFISETAELPFSGSDDTFTACSGRLNVSLFLRTCTP